MVELKGVEPGYPLYGDLALAGGTSYSHDLLRGQGLLVKESLLTQLGVEVGDRVKIGTLEFTIRGVIERAGRPRGFSLGPRVIADYSDVIAAGLTGFGSRARYREYFKSPEGRSEQLKTELRNQLSSQPLISVGSYRDTEDRLSTNLDRAGNYMSLVGLVILVLGGIGISGVTSLHSATHEDDRSLSTPGRKTGCPQRCLVRFWSRTRRRNSVADRQDRGLRRSGIFRGSPAIWSQFDLTGQPRCRTWRWNFDLPAVFNVAVSFGRIKPIVFSDMKGLAEGPGRRLASRT
jgi:hypothetical protein